MQAELSLDTMLPVHCVAYVGKDVVAVVTVVVNVEQKDGPSAPPSRISARRQLSALQPSASEIAADADVVDIAAVVEKEEEDSKDGL